VIGLEKHSDTAALTGRLFFSSMFLLFGYDKLTGYAGTLSYMGSLGFPAPTGPVAGSKGSLGDRRQPNCGRF
jgi:uncharacterized membrane protein YphA (DoxX/SURF4 family)